MKSSSLKNRNAMIRDAVAFVIAIILPQLAGAIGAVFTFPAIGSWYGTLVRPALNPPAWVFGPTWTVLYLLMGIATFLVWKKRNVFSVRAAFGIFALQLLLNALWSILFFGLHNPGLACVDIVFLWCAILGTIVAFAKISKPAAWLLTPYLLWVSFATYLNVAIWVLNS